MLWCNIYCHCGPRQHSQYSDLLRAGWTRDGILVWVRSSAPIQTSPWAHSASNIMGTVSFPEVKQLGHGVNHQLSSSTKVKERAELYVYSPSGPSWPVLRWNFCTFYFYYTQCLILWFIFVTETIKIMKAQNKTSLTRPLLVWDGMQQWLVVSCQCFRTAYWSHLQSTAWPLQMGLTSSPKMPITTNQCYVTSQKSNNLIYTAAEAWNHTENWPNVKNCLLRPKHIYLKECTSR